MKGWKVNSKSPEVERLEEREGASQVIAAGITAKATNLRTNVIEVSSFRRKTNLALCRCLFFTTALPLEDSCFLLRFWFIFYKPVNTTMTLLYSCLLYGHQAKICHVSQVHSEGKRRRITCSTGPVMPTRGDKSSTVNT